jgi:hypothetical protein
MKSDGTERDPIPVADADKNPIGPETAIGNGSRVKVRCLMHHWKKGSRQGVSPLLDRVIVTNLIPYVSVQNEFDFKSSPSKTAENNQSDLPSTDEFEN